MRNLNDDIQYAAAILNNQNKDEFGFIYSRTNENLASLFNKIDVLDKDVYTVLSSSDFLFSALAAGANKVDSFDINPITNRYYHLRKWLLQYGLIDADGQSISDLSYIIKRHIHSDFIDEQNSIAFWQDYLSKIDNIHFYSNILFEYIERPDVPYNAKIKEIVERLKSLEPKFDVIDICSKLDINLNRKYDIIFISNILDYNRESQRLQNACANMLNLLKNSGFVICSHMPQYKSLDVEQEIFSDYFHYDELFVDEKDGQKVLYYKYTRRPKD